MGVAVKKIVIDPGHGGKFTGAVCDGVAEKDVNMAIALLLASECMQRGIKPVLTRFNDVHLSEVLEEDLQLRCNIEHEEQPDLFISIHCNSFSDPSVNGFEIFTTPGETDSDRYATSIFNTVKNTFPALNYRPDLSDGDVDREENFKVLRGTNGPAVLIEAGFLSNQSDFSRLVDRRFRRALAKAICTGFLTAQEA